jgi:hypothetical protein
LTSPTPAQLPAVALSAGHIVYKFDFLAEAGHILYLRIIYPIHIQPKKRILYPITITAKKDPISKVSVYPLSNILPALSQFLNNKKPDQGSDHVVVIVAV